MLRAKLLAATAVTTLMMASTAFAQDATAPAQDAMPAPAEATTAPDPAMPAAPAADAATPQTTEAATPAAGSTVIDTLRSAGNFTTLLSALDQAQLTETLQTRPAVSIFAPTDEAFAALPEAERTRLMDPANVNELREVLLYHVIVADVSPDQIEGRKGGVPNAASKQLVLDGTGEAIKADDATVVSAELDASNGAIFPIDKVLNPDASQAAVGDAESVEDAAPAEAAPEAAPAPAAAPAEAAPEPMAPAPTEAPAEVAPAPEGVTETVEPAMPGDTAPSGEPAAATTTTAAPPVPNPTDGQVDDPAMTPPTQTPDTAADGAEEGDPSTPQ